ncbi:MAG TPA: ABC-2 family transporter protein [Gammaproteobacteria bacterium]
MRRFLELYAALFRIGLLANLQYRAAGMIWMLGLILEPVIFLVVWSRVAEARGEPIGGYDAQAFAAYYMTLMMVNQFTFTWVMESFQYRIQLGELSYELLRPIHPVHHDITDNVAFKLVMLMIMVPALVVVYVAFEPRFDVTPRNAVLAVAALGGAFFLRFFIEWTLALAAFWTTRVAAINRLYYSLVTFLSGRVAPLAVLPAWLQDGASNLPFYYCIGFPVEVLLGELDGPAIARGFVLQAIWLAVAGVVIAAVWKRASRRYAAVGA